MNTCKFPKWDSDNRVLLGENVTVTDYDDATIAVLLFECNEIYKEAYEIALENVRTNNDVRSGIITESVAIQMKDERNSKMKELMRKLDAILTSLKQFITKTCDMIADQLEKLRVENYIYCEDSAKHGIATYQNILDPKWGKFIQSLEKTMDMRNFKSPDLAGPYNGTDAPEKMKDTVLGKPGKKLKVTKQDYMKLKQNIKDAKREILNIKTNMNSYLSRLKSAAEVVATDSERTAIIARSQNIVALMNNAVNVSKDTVVALHQATFAASVRGNKQAGTYKEGRK